MLQPPAGSIYLLKTHVIARSLARKLVAIKLNHNLSRRPSASSLGERNILPKECYKTDADTGAIIYGRVSPSLVSVKRRVEREVIKDGLRTSIERKVKKVEEQGKSGEARDPVGVRGLVRRFTSTAKRAAANATSSESKWAGRMAEKERGRCAPARANVLGLRRFWEGVANT